MTTNTTSFAGYFLAATTGLLDTIASPSRNGFEQVKEQSIKARDAAGDRIEARMANRLLLDIRAAALHHGFGGV